MAHDLFFLTGAPKSGTTWLGKLLDAHPEIGCKGEACVHRFGEGLVKECKKYNDMLVERRAAVSAANAFPLLKWPDVTVLMRTFIELRFNAIVDPDKPHLRFLGEKDPEHGRHFKEMAPLFPEAKFIHIIRDGRGVFVSAWHHNVRNKEKLVDDLGFEGSLTLTAKQWSKYIRLSRDGAKLLNDRYFEVRYEDLVADPGTWLKRALDFLGADSSEEIVQACVEAASFEKLSQGRKAGEEDKDSFFRKGDPDDWRNHLSMSQRQRFDSHSGGILEELGYPV